VNAHLTVDRYLADKPMDHIDHALGRPLDPMRETPRNYFAIGLRAPIAREMAASLHWARTGQVRDMVFFHVTDEGRRALAEHLKTISDPHRAFAVTFDGHTRSVVATSRAKARYSAFLDVSDTCADLTFSAFCRRASVRLA
jgi:hypothetical protein